MVALTYLLGAALVGYVAAGLSRLVSPEVDWLNRDGRFGWGPAARLYHSMLTGHALFGLILTVLWLERFPLAIALTVGHAIGLLVLVLGVRSLSQAMQRRAKAQRLRELEGQLSDRTGRPQDQAALVAEMERSRRIRIRPFAIDARCGVVYTVAWLLPLAAGLWRSGAFGS